MLDIQTPTSERFRRLSKEGLWIVLGQAIAVLGALVGVRLLTELLDPTSYGELALALTLAALVNQTVFGPLGNGATRFYAPAAEGNRLGSYFKALRRMTIAATQGVVLTIIFVIAILFIGRLADWITLTAAALIFSILSGYTAILIGIHNAARRRSVVSLHQGMEPWARLLAAIALMLWLGTSSTVAMIGFALGLLLVFGSLYLFFHNLVPNQRSPADEERNWREQIWTYSWPIAATGVLSWAFFASQRWALEFFARTEDVGLFSALFQIGFTPISLIGTVLMTLLTPVIFSRAGDGADKIRLQLIAAPTIKLCVCALLGLVLATAIGAAAHKLVFQLLVAEKYRLVSHHLPFTIFAAGLFQISLFLSMIILASTKTKILLPINTIGNLIVVAINLLSAYFWGMNGLILAMVAGSAMHLVWNAFNVWRVLRDG